MKIAFIRPSMFGRQSKDAMQPLLFAIIKAKTQEDIEISFFDELVEEIPRDLRVDAVAITVDTFSARRAYKLASFFKDKGSKVIMGGFHPTMMPEECLVAAGTAQQAYTSIIPITAGGLKRS